MPASPSSRTSIYSWPVYRPTTPVKSHANQTKRAETANLGLHNRERRLAFELDKETGLMIRKLIDKQTGKVVKQLPLQAFIEADRKADQLIGHLVDIRV